MGLGGYNPNYTATGQKNLVYGDGSSGSLSVTGSATINTQAFLYVDLNVAAAGTLTIAGAHVWVLGAFVLAGALKSPGGGNASGSTTGARAAQITVPIGASGTSGITTALSSQVGGNGVGLVGDVGGGGKSDGTQQTDGSHAQIVARNRNSLWGGGINNSTVATALFTSSTATGRGSGDGTNAGGGTGTVDTGFILFAKEFIQQAGTISATGGNGGDGAGGTAGGGGAGGSGGLLMVFDVIVGTTITPTRTEGTGGAGQGGAGNGRNGVPGTTLKLVNT